MQFTIYDYGDERSPHLIFEASRASYFLHPASLIFFSSAVNFFYLSCVVVVNFHILNAICMQGNFSLCRNARVKKHHDVSYLHLAGRTVLIFH